MIACERMEVSVSCGTIIGLESSTYHMGTSCRAMLNRIRYMHNHPEGPQIHSPWANCRLIAIIPQK
jgi:hypothetical protein